MLVLLVCHCRHSLTHITCDVCSLFISLFTFPIRALRIHLIAHSLTSLPAPKRFAPLQAIDISKNSEWTRRRVRDGGKRDSCQQELNENVLSEGIINSFPKWHLEVPFCLAFIDFHFWFFAFWLLFSFSHLLQVKYCDLLRSGETH